ncbi:protein-tyrosine phosphatase-like protein [Russula dissimulans]|nr:protein-tyrosine phosphatase-like protein [Russula dissimulans]
MERTLRASGSGSGGRAVVLALLPRIAITTPFPLLFITAHSFKTLSLRLSLHPVPYYAISDMPHTATRNIDTVIDGQLYIGNLSAAKSIDLRLQYGITHIVSVCQDYPLQGPNHMVIPVQDNEYDDILIYLPGACHFIRNAIEGRGRVLVHCLMGISRSATVVASYLMATRHISVQKALFTIKRARPIIQPNYGFIKELHAFEACHYAPSPTDLTYRAWKRRHRQDVTAFLNSLSDQTIIIPERLSLSSDFPTDSEQAACLVTYLGLTHCLSLSPSATFPNNIGLTYNHIEIPQSNKMALLLALPSICRYIQDALDNRGRILVHCLTETTAAIVACAYRKSPLCPLFCRSWPSSYVESARFLPAGLQDLTRGASSVQRD